MKNGRRRKEGIGEGIEAIEGGVYSSWQQKKLIEAITLINRDFIIQTLLNPRYTQKNILYTVILDTSICRVLDGIKIKGFQPEKDKPHGRTIV